jgi:mono/diheme cytochrome c family protein
MKTTSMRILAATVVVSMSWGLAAAAEKGKLDPGKQEYLSKCAVCHGQGGKGDGGVIDLLKKAPSDLTTLSKRNGGVFPFDRVYRVIDGREEIKAHGARDMPIWGDDFRAETTRAAEYYFDTPYDMDMYARARILALIDYLNRIQAK